MEAAVEAGVELRPNFLVDSFLWDVNQEDTNRFIMAREGMVPPEEFFNPENQQRILSNAGLVLPLQQDSTGGACRF